MLTFIKAQAVSLTATAADYLTSFLLVALFHQWYLWASVTGTIVGGITYFVLGRIWAFKAREGNIMPQVGRYLIVWTGYLILSAVFVYLITHYSGAYFLVVKLFVSILLAVGYNYGLQKHFVFKERSK